MKSTCSDFFACLIAGAVIFAATSGAAQRPAAARAPVIRHDPVQIAIPRQPLTIMAQIIPGSAAIRSATLYYTPSRDSAPISQTMTPSGGNLYVATIPPAHLQNVDEIYYYIETVDHREEWAETPYQRVVVRGSSTASSTAEATRPPSRDGDRRQIYWLAGGAAAIGAGAALLASTGGGDNGGGGGSGDDDGTSGPGTVECVREDVLGRWVNADQTVAPGFETFDDNTARFDNPEGAPPDNGAWGLVGCELRLFPSTNLIYRGSGILSADKTTVTINGNTFNKVD